MTLRQLLSAGQIGSPAQGSFAKPVQSAAIAAVEGGIWGGDTARVGCDAQRPPLTVHYPLSIKRRASRKSAGSGDSNSTSRPPSGIPNPSFAACKNCRQMISDRRP
jgi:hypothetical protein